MRAGRQSPARSASRDNCFSPLPPQTGSLFCQAKKCLMFRSVMLSQKKKKTTFILIFLRSTGEVRFSFPPSCCVLVWMESRQKEKGCSEAEAASRSLCSCCLRKPGRQQNSLFIYSRKTGRFITYFPRESIMPKHRTY